jgi:geranylgeranylglycerol-phosphate geranylgeranyltransferase
VLDLLRLLRAHNLVVAALGVLAGGWIALGRLALPAPLGWAALSGIGLGTVGNVLNDIWDEAGDRTNARGDRPLANGRIGRGTADFCVFWGTLVGIGGAALVDGTLVLLAAVALAVMALYSPVLKRRGLAGNVTVAVVGGFPLAYGAIAVGNGVAGIIPWTLAAWLHLGREVTKDLVDVPGDRALGRRTVPIVWGESRARSFARVILWAFVPASLALPAMARFGGWYFALAGVADVLVLAAAAGVAKNRLDGAIRQLKYAMPVGVAALVLGRIG